ncbi:FAD-binding oxidoreductase [Pantoea dispersa]|uniref:NAD(P)/FAD-dependent oxidoreductase n=1 Tax=Pantoea dispersa TaxID=59814 RepID=UPI001BAA5C57|nr:FAD-dependent oxidoreductase [Pantoea dispersa]MBS0907585.1 FAD-binding oxidoreductase [Pantoea dispersa]
MNTVFDVAVIGAGSTGATIAAMLAERQINVILVEKELPALTGASAWSGGIFRQYDPDLPLLALARIKPECAVVARAIHESRMKTGVEIQLTSAQYQHFRSQLAESALFSEEDRKQILAAMIPLDETADVLRLKDCDGGFSAVRKYVTDLCSYIRQHAVVLERTEISKVESVADQLHLHTGHSVIRTRYVVDACGAGGPFERSLEGIYARTVPFSRVYLERAPERPVISYHASTYVLPLSKTLVQIGGSERQSASSLDDLPCTGKDSETLLRQKLNSTGIDTRGFQLLQQFVSWDSWTSDGRPVIGFSQSQPRVMTVSGFNGVGFKLAPGAAMIAVNLLMDVLFDVSQPDRFRDLATLFTPGRFARTEGICV